MRSFWEENRQLYPLLRLSLKIPTTASTTSTTMSGGVHFWKMPIHSWPWRGSGNWKPTLVWPIHKLRPWRLIGDCSTPKLSPNCWTRSLCNPNSPRRAPQLPIGNGLTVLLPKMIRVPNRNLLWSMKLTRLLATSKSDISLTFTLCRSSKKPIQQTMQLSRTWSILWMRLVEILATNTCSTYLGPTEETQTQIHFTIWTLSKPCATLEK